MEELTSFSKKLEETSKGSVEGTARNEELKQEFRIFYEAYQTEESVLL